MCRKALLTALVITCTFSPESSHAINQSTTKNIEHVKDLLCVLLLSGVQKDDLDENTLRKLERHNINIEDLNNEARRADCAESRKRTNSTSNTTLIPQVVLGDKNQIQDQDQKCKSNKTAVKSNNIVTYLQANNYTNNNDTSELQTTKPEGQQTKPPTQFYDIYSKIKGDTMVDPLNKFNRSELINQRFQAIHNVPQLHNSYKHRNKHVGKTNDVFLTRSNEMETIEKYFAKKYLSKFKDDLLIQRTPKRQNVKRGKDFTNKMLLRYLEDDKIGEDIDMYSDSAFNDNSRQEKSEMTERTPLHEIFINNVLAKTIDPDLYETTTQSTISKNSLLMKELKEEILNDLKKKFNLEMLTTTSKPKSTAVYEHITSTHKTKEQIIDEFKETIVQDLKREFNFSLWTTTTVTTPVVPTTTTTTSTTTMTTVTTERATTTTTTTEMPKEDIVNKLKTLILNDLRDEIRKATSTKTPVTTFETTTAKSEEEIIKAVKDIVLKDLMKALLIQITTPSTTTSTSTEVHLIHSIPMTTSSKPTLKPTRVGNEKTYVVAKKKEKIVERTTVRTTFIVSEISKENNDGESNKPAETPLSVELRPSVEIEIPKSLKDLKEIQANKVIEKFMELYKQLKSIKDPVPSSTKSPNKITKKKNYVAEDFMKHTPKPVKIIETTTEPTTTSVIETEKQFNIIPITNTGKPFVELNMEPAYDYNIEKTNDNDVNINLGGPVKINDNPLPYSINMASPQMVIDQKTIRNTPILYNNANNNKIYPYNIPQHYKQPNMGSPMKTVDLPHSYRNDMDKPMTILPQTYLREVPQQDKNPEVFSQKYVRYNGMASPYINYNDAPKTYINHQTNLARPYTNDVMRSSNVFNNNAQMPFEYMTNAKKQKPKNFVNILSNLAEAEEIESPSIPDFESQHRVRNAASHIILQTNSDEIAPLAIPIEIKNSQHLQKVIQNQNIIVTTPKYTYSKEDEIYKHFIAKHKSFRNNRHKAYAPRQENKRGEKHRSHGRERKPKHKGHYLTHRDFENISANNGDDERLNKEDSNVSKRLYDSDETHRYDYRDFETPHRSRHGIKSYQQREYKRKDRTRVKAGRGLKEPDERANISPRYQMKIKHRPMKYDDTHFKDFLKTQEKVTEMLEKLLAPNKTQ